MLGLGHCAGNWLKPALDAAVEMTVIDALNMRPTGLGEREHQAPGSWRSDQKTSHGVTLGNARSLPHTCRAGL
jgi:hypothetical protein